MAQIEIDWATLHSAFAMNMPEVRCFLSIEDGAVVKLGPGDGQVHHLERSTTHVTIGAVPPRVQYQWLDAFIKSIEDEALRVRMEAAVNGKGAFRRFKDILLGNPEERRRWFEFRDQLMRDYIVQWVQEKGIQPLNEPPWSGDGDGDGGYTHNNADDLQALRRAIVQWAEGQNVSASHVDGLVEHLSRQFRIRPL